MAAITLRNDDDAWAALQRYVASIDASTRTHLVFDGWPSTTVTIRPGNGVITPEIERAMRRLRQGIYRAYAVYRYGSPDPRRLSQQDRRQLAPEWQVRPGSTRIDISMVRAASHFMRAAVDGMSAARRAAVVIGLGLMVCSTTIMVADLYHSAELAKSEAQIAGQRELVMEVPEISQEDRGRMQLLASALEQDHTNAGRFAAAGLIPWRSAILEIAPPDPAATIVLNSVVTIGARPAKQIAKIMKSGAKKQRVLLANSGPTLTGWIATVSTAAQLPAPMKLGMRA